MALRGARVWIAILGLFGVAGVGLVYSGYRFFRHPSSSATDSARYVFYEVKPGEAPSHTAKELERIGVISSARWFYWYSRLSGKTEKFKSGDYRFHTRMLPSEVANIVMSGISYGIPLTVPEGFNLAQISEALDVIRPGAGQRLLHVANDRGFVRTTARLFQLSDGLQHLEGYLFPDTYLVGRKTTEEEILRSMVRKFREVFTDELSSRASQLGMTEHQVVTLASIVEKETGAKQERPMIASVFHNRLKKKMRLQSDPTVIYGVKDYSGNITKRDLEAHTPYNTYVIPGLPPGPIASPGKDAIVAVLYPSDSEFLFFVSHNDGTHEFTTNYRDHQKAVAKYQLDRRAREGKSWRDLNRAQTGESARAQ